MTSQEKNILVTTRLLGFELHTGQRYYLDGENTGYTAKPGVAGGIYFNPCGSYEHGYIVIRGIQKNMKLSTGIFFDHEDGTVSCTVLDASGEEVGYDIDKDISRAIGGALAEVAGNI